MASRPRCSKRGSTGKEIDRHALANIGSLQNTSEPATRKYQKLLVDEIPSAPVAAPRPRAKAVTKKTASAKKKPTYEKIYSSTEILCISDGDEQSSDSSPHQPAWFRDVPHQLQLSLKTLANTGLTLPNKEREALIQKCMASFEKQAHVDEFREWIDAQQRVSTLTAKLCRTGVGSPKAPGAVTNNISTFPNLYTEEISDNLLAREDVFRIVPDYMETVQKDVTHNMRSILVDWLVEVGEEYKLSSQTLFLAVNYVDRLLGIQSINRNKLQLLGITSMLVAAKYEEIYPPTIDELVYISDNTYSRKDVVMMESLLLTTLKFHLSAPTAWEFTRSFCLSACIGDRPKFLAQFLAELFMMFSCSLKYKASTIAAASVFLALYTLHLPPWPVGLVELAGGQRKRQKTEYVMCRFSYRAETACFVCICILVFHCEEPAQAAEPSHVAQFIHSNKLGVMIFLHSSCLGKFALQLDW